MRHEEKRKAKRPIGFRIFRFLIRRFLPAWRVVWRREEPDPDLACVFVCNHAKATGPVVMSAYFPRTLRPWITEQMLSLKTMPSYMRNDLFPARTRLAYGILTVAIAPIALGALRSAKPISSRSGKDAGITIRESVESLIGGESNLIFPENPQKIGSQEDGCGELQTGFLHIAPAYYEKTGRPLPFYPVAICARDHTIRVGTRVSFDPDRAFMAQKAQIAKRLRTAISDLMRIELK